TAIRKNVAWPPRFNRRAGGCPGAYHQFNRGATAEGRQRRGADDRSGTAADGSSTAGSGSVATIAWERRRNRQIGRRCPPGNGHSERRDSGCSLGTTVQL